MGKKEGSYKPSAFRADADNWQERQATILANLNTKRQLQNDPLEDDEEDGAVDSESDEDEDDYGEELTPAMDAAILRTLRMIRRGEGVYGNEKVLEEALKVAETEATQRKITARQPQNRGEKKYTLQDFQRQALLSQNQGGPSRSYNPHGEEDHYEVPETIIPLTHVEEERLLRREVTQAFHTSGAANDDEDEEDDDGFLVKKEKTDQETHAESQKYRDFLLSQAGGEEAVRELLGLKEGGMEGQDHRYDEVEEDEESDDGEVEVDIKQEGGQVQVKREKKPKKSKKVRTKKDDDEFLMNYILNRGWIDQDDPSVPPAEKKAKASSSKLQAEEEDEIEQEEAAGPWGTLEDDEEFDDLADEFENTYNFRFEEPGAANIITHARTLPNTVRRADDSRKLARQAKAERKAEKAAQYAENTKREKGKKRREIEKRMEALSKELGAEGFKQLEQELEGDWDEEGFDRIVQRIVGADADAGDDEDDEKPTWGDDIDTAYAEEDDEDEMYDNDGDHAEGYEDEFAEAAGDEEMEVAEEAYEEEDGPINMDADFIAIPDENKRKSRKDKKKKKDKGKGRATEEDVEMDDVEGLSVDAQKAKIKAAMEDYSKLDYEDVIDDLPTRFKYTKAEPQTYGLTSAEILLATDAELNDFLAVKHYAPYRHGSGVGSAGRGMKDRLKALRAKLAARRWGEEEVPENDKSTKRKQDAGWKAKNKQSANGNPIKGDGPKKRKGKKERQRQAATGGDGEGEAAGVVGGKRKERDEDGGESSSKKQKV